MGRANQPRDRRGRWTETGAGSRLGSQRQDFARALQSQGRVGDNDGRSTVYAYLRDKDSPSGKAGSPYYVGVAGDVTRPYDSRHAVPVPADERRIRLLRQNVTHEQAREWEKYYIQKFGRADISSGRGMTRNRTNGGDGTPGLRQSAEHKAKIGAANKGRSHSEDAKAKMSAANKGRVHSESTKAKMSETHRGRHASEETRAKISAARQNMTPVTRAKMSAAAKSRPPEVREQQAATRARNTAIRLGVDPDVFSRLTLAQRNAAQQRSKQQGMTVSQYIEKMRPKWGI